MIGQTISHDKILENLGEVRPARGGTRPCPNSIIFYTRP